jgi:hypothetical protein
LKAEHEKSQRGKLRDLTPDQHEAIDRMHEAAVNKMLHSLTTKLRETAADPAEARALDAMIGALTELFDLDSDDAMMNNADSLAPRASKPPRRSERVAPAPLAEGPGQSPVGDSR